VLCFRRSLQGRASRWQFVLLATTAILFRIPALINADGVHSDAAVIGLQARHMLAGEWSWFVWGTNYQGALDPLLTAIAFAIAGPSPLALMLVPLLGHLLLMWLVFDSLRGRLGNSPALIATLPLVVAPHAINSVALYAPRQWSVTAIFASIWLLDRASTSRRPLPRFAAGVGLAVFALYLDLFVLQLLPGVLLFALLCCFDGNWRDAVARRVGTSAIGGTAGAMAVWGLYRQAPPDARWSQTARVSLAQVGMNVDHFWQEVLPWVLSAVVYVPGSRSGELSLWEAPPVLRWLQIVGAMLLVAAICCGGALVFMRRMPWAARRLGILGLAFVALSVVGFLMSPAAWIAGPWGARYLAPIIWGAPLALAPVAYLLRPRRFAAVLAPYLIAAAVAGWLGFGPYVRGPLPVRAPPTSSLDEARVRAFLRERAISYAAAEYWLAYRLTFLWEEQPIVRPLMPVDGDRYQPYQRGFDAASDVALIFHPYAPHAPAGAYARQLDFYGPLYERFQIGEFTVFVLHKQACAYLPALGRRPSC
jgi:hypothetical protein